jgi:hypothetical protein
MCKQLLLFGLLLFFFSSCQKEESASVPTGTTYTIEVGQHYSDNSTYKPINALTAMNFTAYFDSSAIYTTVDPANQSDINKLYGFSDNNQHHHAFSARIGWRWLNNNLELLGYVYNDSLMSYQRIGNFPLLKDLNCSIRVQGNQYVFSVDGTTTTLPRTSSGPTATGYQLYPYFGGTEPAPHKIIIKITDR